MLIEVAKNVYQEATRIYFDPGSHKATIYDASGQRWVIEGLAAVELRVLLERQREGIRAEALKRFEGKQDGPPPDEQPSRVMQTVWGPVG